MDEWLTPTVANVDRVSSIACHNFRSRARRIDESLMVRGKKAPIVISPIAREFIDFMLAIARQVELKTIGA